EMAAHAQQWKLEEQYVAATARRISSAANVPATSAVLSGDPVEELCRRARETGADLTVMTSHGRTGLSRAWLGSIAVGVVRRSAIPVLVLRPTDHRPISDVERQLFSRILVPLDGSELARDILPAAAALARCSGGQIVLLRVVHPVPALAVNPDVLFAYAPPVPDDAATRPLVEEAERDLVEASRMLAESGARVVAHRVIVAEHVAQAIIGVASGAGADVIAMSTHGRGTSRLALGSVADKVLRASGLPLLMRRPAKVAEESLAVGVAAAADQLPALSPGWARVPPESGIR
ncbi:MAG TPA: universal stress protein, partial [Gemmatimonadaceae bacterium]|nr:universal stress protein [Gemmatimonadaceae bacterium]